MATVLIAFMKKYFTLKQKRFYLLIGVTAILIGGVSLSSIINMFKPYIGDNILHLPFFNTALATETRLSSPWEEQRINTLFLYRSLFMPDSTLSMLKPDLASSWTLTDNGTKYTIIFEEDNYWSDGELITLEDVVFTIKALLKGETVADMYRTVMQYIVGATDFREGNAEEISGLSIDGNKLTIDLIETYNNFLIVLSQAVIVPKHILESEDLNTLHTNDFWVNPVVSGMYQLEDLIEDTDTNEHYFKLTPNLYYNDEKSDITEVRLHINYQEQELDYYDTNHISDIVNYSKNNVYTKHKVNMLLYSYFVFNVSGDDRNYNEAMDDILFRTAILHALDREQLLSDVYFNNGEVVHSGIPSYTNLGNDFEYTYDPEQAKKLLSESLYDIDRPFRIAYSNQNNTTFYFLSKVSEYLEEIGLSVELVHIPLEHIYTNRKYDMLLKDLTAFNEMTWYSEYDYSRDTFNKLYHTATMFDGLYPSLCTSQTIEEEQFYFEKLQEVEQETLYKLPLFVLNQIVYTNNNRLSIPDDVVFGNSWYRYDIQLKDWAIKKN